MGTASSQVKEHTRVPCDYYGQRNPQGLPHGMGLRLSSDGVVVSRQCGHWIDGKLEEHTWVWCGFLPMDDAPFSVIRHAASGAKFDAINHEGSTYRGQMHSVTRQPDGCGKTWWPDGTPQSEGFFVSGKLQGVAKIHHRPNDAGHVDVYSGYVHQGVPQGHGYQTYAADGSMYEGSWENGQRHGTGREIQRNKIIYEGQWSRDKRHGLGVFLTGTQYRGLWKDNEFVECHTVPRRMLPIDSKILSAATRAAGPHILLLSDGCGYYSGGLNAADQRHGEGSVYSENGALIRRGIWNQDEFVSRLPSNIAVARPRPPLLQQPVPASPSPAVIHNNNNNEASTQCVICMDRPRDCLIDCVHFCLCYECARTQHRCPLCRVAITQRMQKRLVVS
jgi:hypothetical protein